MSIQQSQYIINNGRRFDVAISTYHKDQNYIVYEATVMDTAFLITYSICFRFKSLRKLHERMSKQYPHDLPEFPKTKSFGLWNRTNESPKLIEERIRDLQYYLTKVLNNFNLLKLQQMQYIIKTLHRNKLKRSYSQAKPSNNPTSYQSKWKECPEFYRKEKIGVGVLES